MPRERVPIEIEEIGTRMRQTHPAFAMIGASRVSSTPGESLFGSDFRHQHYMTIAIHEADNTRDLSRDWPHATKLVAEVALSEAQWATFVSTPNVGHGVQCTLQWKDGPVPGIVFEPDLGNRAQFREEVADQLYEAIHAIDEVLASPALRKTDRAKLEHAKRELEGNLDFVVSSFNEHAEKTVEKVKIEVSAYLEHLVRNAGLEALGASAPVALIESGETDVR